MSLHDAEALARSRAAPPVQPLGHLGRLKRDDGWSRLSQLAKVPALKKISEGRP